MDANTLARIENEYSKLNESINKLGDYLLKQYAIMLQYADVLAQRIHLARKEK